MRSSSRACWSSSNLCKSLPPVPCCRRNQGEPSKSSRPDRSEGEDAVTVNKSVHEHTCFPTSRGS
jgi:hypothetical protein